MKQVAVIGAGDCSDEEYKAAERVGVLLADHHAILFCGGLGGVMEAAAKGAHAQGGTTVGIIPGTSGENPYCRNYSQDRDGPCQEYSPCPVCGCRDRNRRFLWNSFRDFGRPENGKAGIRVPHVGDSRNNCL